MKVLIIEDEIELSKSIVSYLKNESYTCETAADYSSALEKIDEFDYDCIILDITLPGGSGLQIMDQLKQNNKTDGIIIVSARNSIDDRINGLRLGADDYLPKPFHLSELSARITAIIRRKQFTGSNVLIFHEISVDTLSRQVAVNDKNVDLTKKEYQLLLYFMANKGRVISKNAIAQHLWGDSIDTFGKLDFIYTHIKNLKKKLNEAGCDDYIRAIYGTGYKFSD